MGSCFTLFYPSCIWRFETFPFAIIAKSQNCREKNLLATSGENSAEFDPAFVRNITLIWKVNICVPQMISFPTLFKLTISDNKTN